MADNLGIFVSSVASTAAVTADATGPGPGSNGVHASTTSPSDSAIYGEHRANGIGVFGRGGPAGGEGVFGETSSGFSAVYGKNAGTGTGVTGESVQGFGVRGSSVDETGVRATSKNGFALTAEARASAFYAHRNTGSGEGVFLAANDLAGEFFGNVRIVGTLMKQAGGFMIDHPLDPSSKYLCHSFVESADMLNVYSGNVQLSERGEATVKLPEWFEALNAEYRYQLTPIGAPAPGLFVSREIERNAFSIAGGTPRSKVSWQVSGVRRDAYAARYPIHVEQEKPAKETGTLLSPELSGTSHENGLKERRMRDAAKRTATNRDEAGRA